MITLSRLRLVASTATISPSSDVVFEFPETAPVIFYRVVID
jgi:hypothetical protein